MSEVESLVQKLQLLPHPEGGYYKETYRSEGVIRRDALGTEFNGDRNYATSIYFLLTSDNFSAFHRIKQDEIWHFYKGSAIRLHMISPNGEYTSHLIGADIAAGEVPQFVVPAGYWFASEVSKANSYSLAGCGVAPGFDFADFDLPARKDLIALYPEHEQIITKLTRV